MADLFADAQSDTSRDHGDVSAPLADRLRPRTLSDIIGQEHLTGPEGAIGRMVAAGRLSSMILWGPPGTGKTSIARLLAEAVGMRFAAISAVFSGVADLKKVFAEAEVAQKAGQRTLLFVDEIHRFNRAQQDGFLPFVERGTVTLVGATTENPSFELNAALLSRAQVLVLHRLDVPALLVLLDRAEELEGRPLPLTPDAREALAASADGDGRFLLNQAETLYAANIPEPLDPAALGKFLQRRVAVYDKDREGHYNLISALHKSLRGSDPQAALYYLARMLTAGEEPLYVLRRLTRFASEDIGLADPQALAQCMAAKDAYEFLGSPEGELAIVQACLYLATAPKSNAAYVAQKEAWKSARETGSLAPPANILNAPTKLMKDLGYGSGYSYDHDSGEGFSGANYWPEGMAARTYYRPVERGFERQVIERIAYWDRLRVNGAIARKGNDMRKVALAALLLIGGCKGEPAPSGDATATAAPSSAATAAAAPVKPDLASCRQKPDDANPDLERTRPLPVLAGLADKLEANRTSYALATLGGGTLCISTSWMEAADDVKLSADGRFVSFAWSGYEAGGFILADRAGKGQAVETGAEPVFAPDRQRLAAVEFSESGFGSLNGFAVWQVEAEGLRQLARLDVPEQMSEWRIDGWKGDSCVNLSAIAFDDLQQDDAGEGNGRRTRFAARASGKGWTIAPAAGGC